MLINGVYVLRHDSIAPQQDVALCRPKRNEWHIGGRKVPAEAVGIVGDEVLPLGI
jgi:hypothetical protein